MSNFCLKSCPIIKFSKQEGRIPQLQPVLHQLVQVGFRVRSEVLAVALQLAGEQVLSLLLIRTYSQL
ncbi:DUF3368 domain-containing protein [Microcoleus sp. T3_A4]|uniref:DUF3368 domain-containing protein n=1 Tax=Microcoleus sp. T3_A4 TaxID=2818968 RepID=UPI00404071A9